MKIYYKQGISPPLRAAKAQAATPGQSSQTPCAVHHSTGLGEQTSERTEKFEPANWQELLAVAAAIDLDIFQALAEKPQTAAGLAGRLGYDRRATEMLLLALADLGHLKQEDGIFQVSPPAANAMVNQESPAYTPNAILHSRNIMERWLTIPQAVRTGKQVPRHYTRKRRRVFVHSMHDMSRGAAHKIVEQCLKRQPDIRTVLDIGGGPGTYARLFADRDIDVTILDTSEVIEIVKPELAAWPRIKMVPGDFNQGLPQGRFDLVFMGNIFHIYSPEKNRRLLSRARKVLNPGGVAAIVDLVRGRSSRAAMFALTMLVNTDGGGTWPEDQYRAWLKEAGFGDITLIDIKERDAQLILASTIPD